MDLYKIHRLIDLISNRSQNGWFSPEEKDEAIHQASLMNFDDCYKRYAIDQDAQDDLAPFKKKYDFTNSSSPGGLITLPSDYQHFLGGYVQMYNNQRAMIEYYPIEVLNDDELADRLRSQLVPVNTTSPVAQWYSKGKIQLWPKEPNAGYLSYLKYPDPPELVYQMNGRELIYDSANSVQLEWDESNTRKIAFGAMQLLGITIDGDKIIQYMNELKK